jgi:hypothetical protein
MTVAIAFALAALMAAIAGAHAGQKVSQPTIIAKSGSAGWAYGTLGSARNGPASSEGIECGISAYAPPSPASTTFFCWANDAAGQFAFCLATGEAQLKVLQAARGDSAIYFEWDATGKCTYLSIANGSAYEPKLP